MKTCLTGMIMSGRATTFVLICYFIAAQLLRNPQGRLQGHDDHTVLSPYTWFLFSTTLLLMIFGLVFNDLVTEQQECTSTAADGNLMDGTSMAPTRARYARTKARTKNCRVA